QDCRWQAVRESRSATRSTTRAAQVHGRNNPRGQARRRGGPLRTPVSRLLGLGAIAMLLITAVPHAQAPAGTPSSAPHQALPAPEAAVDFPKIKITAERSTVLATEFDITRIAITDPKIADAVVVQPREILIDGKAPGTV